MMIEAGSSALPALKALAHESRLRLLALIAEEPRSVQDIAALLGLRESTVSHHLTLLWDAGLVQMRKEGNVHWYALEPAALQRLGRSIASREALPPVEGADDARTVANYLDADGRLKAFPASRKKRRAILVWLTRQIAEGRIYREAEINALIEKRHHDFETFRRELVGYRMLARKDGSYWRLPEEEWAA
jgi:biotin operon repressor